MTFSPQTIFLTLLGGIILAGVIAWIRKARLVVLVPRLFSHSQLTDRGQLAEVTVFNRGFKTEEKVELDFSPSLKIEIVGSNSQDVSLSRNKVSIERIGPSDEVTILLLVEGGTFTKSDITNCLSRETKGKIVTKLEEVIPTGPQRIGLISGLFALPVVFYLMDIGANYLIHSRFELSGSAKKETRAILGWNISTIYERTGGALFEEFKEGHIPTIIGKITRKGNAATIPVTVENKTRRIIQFSLSMTSGAAEERIPSYRRSFHDVFISPGRVAERSITVTIPQKSTDPAERVVLIEVFLISVDGDSLQMKRIYTIE